MASLARGIRSSIAKGETVSGNVVVGYRNNLDVMSRMWQVLSSSTCEPYRTGEKRLTIFSPRHLVIGPFFGVMKDAHLGNVAERSKSGSGASGWGFPDPSDVRVSHYKRKRKRNSLR